MRSDAHSAHGHDPEIGGLPNAAVYYPLLGPEDRRLWDLSSLGAHGQIGIAGAFRPEAGYGNWFWGLTPSCAISLLETAGFRIDYCARETFAHTFICTPVAAPFQHYLPETATASDTTEEQIAIPSHIPEGGEARILDCGAGPLTVVGRTWKGRRVVLTAVDALADEYGQLLAEHAIVPPVRTIRCDAKRLDEMFDANAFDLVYMRNALDHSCAPILGLRQMVRVTKPGGVVVLQHYVDAGEGAGYEGLHRWNFRAEGDDFVIWNRRNRIVVNDHLRGVTIHIVPPDTSPWLTVIVRKHG